MRSRFGAGLQFLLRFQESRVTIYCAEGIEASKISLSFCDSVVCSVLLYICQQIFALRFNIDIKLVHRNKGSKALFLFHKAQCYMKKLRLVEI